MFCQFCGGNIGDGALYCSKCGKGNQHYFTDDLGTFGSEQPLLYINYLTWHLATSKICLVVMRENKREMLWP